MLTHPARGQVLDEGLANLTAALVRTELWPETLLVFSSGKALGHFTAGFRCPFAVFSPCFHCPFAVLSL